MSDDIRIKSETLMKAIAEGAKLHREIEAAYQELLESLKNLDPTELTELTYEEMDKVEGELEWVLRFNQRFKKALIQAIKDKTRAEKN